MKKALYVILLWTVVFLVSYGVLSATGLVPIEFVEINSRIGDIFLAQAKNADGNRVVVSGEIASTSSSSAKYFSETVLPERIVIEKINVNTPVINPETRDIAVLDQALLQGVVRFPGSGGLDDESNMFLF